jgi:hypothetical protein
MKATLAVFSAVLLQCGSAHAAFTDFSDYTQRRTFAAGETFQSKGVTFKALNWWATGPYPITNPVAVDAGASYAILYCGPGVELLLPTGAREVSFRYSTGAASGIAVNGTEPTTYPGQGGTPYQAGFQFLDGTSLGGVSVTTNLTTNETGHEEGLLTLRGQINSVAVAGLELSLDDIMVLVPEPSGGAVLLSAWAAMALATRRRKR